VIFEKHLILAKNLVADKTGSLSIGKTADMMLLKQSPFSMPAELLENIVVDKVWRKGVLVNGLKG